MMDACRRALPGMEALFVCPSVLPSFVCPSVCPSGSLFRPFFAPHHFLILQHLRTARFHKDGIWLSVASSFEPLRGQVRKALDSEFGQAVAVASLVRPRS